MYDDLRKFVVIVEHGNVTTASEALGLTQPALSKCIRRLESMLEVTLFIRTSRGVATTDAGQLIYSRAKAMETEIEYMRWHAAEAKGGVSKVFRIGVGPIWSVTYLQEILTKLRAAFPDTKLEIHVHGKEILVDRLSSGQLDVAICGTNVDVADKNLTKEDLTEVETVVMCRTGHPLSLVDNPSIENLLSYEWISFEPDHDYVHSLNILFKSHDLPPPSLGLVTNSWLSGIMMVANGDYLMNVPKILEKFASKFGVDVVSGSPVIQRFPSGLWYRTGMMDFEIGQTLREIVRHQIS